MKERPILFCAPMVSATLDGRKGVTRRVVKGTLPFAEMHSELQEHYDVLGWGEIVPGHMVPPCPYGRPGDRLWVKETFYAIGDVDGPQGSGQCWLHYRADESNNLDDRDHQWRGPWTSPLFMRRRFSRITLEITGVRVERLQDITSDQILAEGVRIPVDATTGNMLIDISTPNGPSHFMKREQCGDADALLRAHWAALWIQINGIDSWNANPLVWVVEFKRIDQQASA